ncbi:MAG: phosphate ABC transporter permease PstA [Proteobacteria bacterium]|nr:phosphate ABC transporter permease PstA [Pseudomonadota bacterium]
MSSPAAASTRPTHAKVAASLRRRYRSERLFRAAGLAAVAIGIVFVVFVFYTIIAQGYGAFAQTYLRLEVDYTREVLDPNGTHARADLESADYAALVKGALRAQFPEVTERPELRALYALVSSAAEVQLRERVLANPALVGQRESVWLLAKDQVDLLAKGQVDRRAPEADRNVDDRTIAWFDRLAAGHRVAKRFNVGFFTGGDSREPEQAGVWGAVVGSLLTLVVTLALSFPIGVAAAVYLEEFAPRNRLTDLIEVNINNLAAVPSIVFGLLGLAVFIQFFGLPRSAPLVGGLVLTLMTLPTIIITSRAALKAVPPSIREAALGMGASPVQTVLHHVLPLSLPGMLTGAIIGMARALGESAPLLMIGMVAFVADVPRGLTSAATVLPVQVYLWSNSPERAFVERTSGAIIVLLAFLLVMNAAAVVLRSRFERRW